jgi:hypothetical protein
MNHPARTLLYDLFVYPILQLLQHVLDWFALAASNGG